MSKCFLRYLAPSLLLGFVFFSSAHASNNVIDAVVNIEFSKTRAWDDGYNSSGVGTGFVIDAEQGLILTNKHILSVAPVIAYAEFSNKKTIPLVPVYRDPVHDFGVFKYDPSLLDGLQIKAIELSTDANVGEPITLYGNDGGEALSIIEGVLSRIDRTAPNYNSTNTDFNTFYYQAALGSSGGSSGSPILNSENKAIAINAGGRTDTAAAFLLPMKIVLPVLTKVINNEAVSRGTLQTVFRFEPYNQLRRIGWDNERIETAKQNLESASGRLVIEQIVPQSPASNALEVGDILLRINQQALSDFYQLETILNDQVASTIQLSLERQGALIEREVVVSDLFALMPNAYLYYGRSVIIEAGLSLARMFNVPTAGAMIVDPGPLFGSQNIRPLAIVDEINNQPVSSLKDLSEELAKVAYGDKFSLRYRYPYDNANQEYKQVRDYTQWFSNQHCVSELGKVLWQCEPLIKNPEAKAKASPTTKKSVTSAIVDIEVFRPVAVNMNNDVIRRGYGVIVDADAGYIITDRSLIDSALSQIQVAYNNGVFRDAQVLAIHPYLNMVLIQADHQALRFARKSIPKLTQISSAESSELKAISKSSFKDFSVESNLGWPIVSSSKLSFDTYAFSIQPDSFSFYVDDSNRLVAIIPAYTDQNISHSGIPVEFVYDFVERVKRGDEGLYKPQDTFNYVSYGAALELGLPEAYQQQIGRFIAVNKAEQLAQSGLQSGDLLLRSNQKEVTSFNDFYLSLNSDTTDMKILRNGDVLNQAMRNKFVPFEELDEVLFWGGAIIHEIPLNVAMPDGPSDTCLRVGIRYFGAPLYSARASGSFCVFSVDGERVNTLKELKALVFDKETGDYTILKTIDLDKNFQLFEYRLTEDTYYWPTTHYQNVDGRWQIKRAH